jgi:hypothetical protein
MSDGVPRPEAEGGVELIDQLKPLSPDPDNQPTNARSST